MGPSRRPATPGRAAGRGDFSCPAGQCIMAVPRSLFGRRCTVPERGGRLASPRQGRDPDLQQRIARVRERKLMYGDVMNKYRDLLVFACLAILCVATVFFLGKDVSRHISESLKILLAVGALCLVLGWTSIPKRVAIILLSFLVFVSAANYMRWGPTLLTERIDSYDVIHYYLGAKYFDELGYYDLYPSIALADYEAGPFNPGLDSYRAQDPVSGYAVRPISDAIEHGGTIRETSFSPERWESFRKDFLHLQRDFTLTRKHWATLLKDRGFNGTPAWVALVSPVAKLVPVDYIKWLCSADILFLGIGLLFVRWAYGNITALWALEFLFLSYSLRWPVVGWAFFRYDWVCALLVGLALIKKNRHFPAGIMVAVAGSFRLFPVIWLFGPAAKGMINLVNFKDFSFNWNRKLLLLAAGFLVAMITIEGVALVDLGTAPVKSHANNIAEHIKPEELSSRRLGFVIGMFYDGRLLPEFLPHERKIQIKNNKIAHMAAAFSLLGVLAWFLRNRPDDEAFAYGFIPFFMLLTASYYYAVVRILLIVIHASHMDQRRHRIALAMLLALELFSHWAEISFEGHRVFLIGNLAWGLTIYAIYIVWSLYKDEKETRTP